MSDPLRLILFDCDGTLIDSQHMIVAAMEHAFTENGVPPLPRERVLSIVGLSLNEAIAHLLPEVEEERRLAVTRTYRDAFFDLRSKPELSEPVFEGMPAVLDALSREENLMLGIVTGKSDRGLEHILGLHDLRHYFVTLQTADRHPSKPHPGMVHAALRETGAEAANTLVVGDTTFDMEMARAAKAGALGVSWGYHPSDDLVRAGAHDVIHAVEALPARFSDWWTRLPDKESS